MLQMLPGLSPRGYLPSRLLVLSAHQAPTHASPFYCGYLLVWEGFLEWSVSRMRRSNLPETRLLVAIVFKVQQSSTCVPLQMQQCELPLLGKSRTQLQWHPQALSVAFCSPAFLSLAISITNYALTSQRLLLSIKV